MSRGLFLTLLVLALLAVGLAVVFERGSAGRQQLGTGELLLPGLEEQSGELQEVEVLYAGEQPIFLYRAGEDWNVIGYEGYPADLGKLSELLGTLVEMELEEAKTANPEYHSELGLSEPSEEQGGALQIRLAGAGKRVLADILFGDEAASRSGQYVRKSGENQSWLVDRRLPDVPFEAWEWLRQPLLEIPYERIREVRLDSGPAERYRLYRESPEEQHLQLENMPDGRELDEEDALDKYGALLQSLSFTGLSPAEEAEFPGQAAVTASFVCFNGLGITAELAQQEPQAGEESGQVLLRLGFSLEAVPGRTAPAAGEDAGQAAADTDAPPVLAVPVIGEAVSAPAKELLPDTAAAAAEREQLETLHAPWVYQIDIEDFNGFKLNTEDVLKEEG